MGGRDCHHPGTVRPGAARRVARSLNLRASTAVKRSDMHGAIQDLQYGLRSLIKSPGFTAVAVLTLALGVGANAAIFSVLRAVVLRDLVYHDADRIAVMWTKNIRQNLPDGSSYLNFRDWKEQSKTFEQMAGLYQAGVHARYAARRPGSRAGARGRSRPRLLRTARHGASARPDIRGRRLHGSTARRRHHLTCLERYARPLRRWRLRGGTNRQVLDAWRHRRGKRNRDLQRSPLAAHRPLSAQRVLDHIELRRRRTCADLRPQVIDLFAPPILRPIQKQILGGNLVRQCVIPPSQPASTHRRARRRVRATAGLREDAGRRSGPADRSPGRRHFPSPCR